MSIFVAEVLSEGIVFAADKNVTIRGRDADGNIIGPVQDLGSKVLRWPKQKALLGYVGRASVGGQSMHDWLYDFIGDHITFDEPADVANALRERAQRDLGGANKPASIIQFATFARRGGHMVPEFWHITNVADLYANGDYLPPQPNFVASERLLGVHLVGHATPANIRQVLRSCADASNPFWFHQGFDLAVFNTVSTAVKQAFAVLQQAGRLPPPRSLDDWERHGRMWVLMYGAYFEAFGAPGQRYVGGGADALSIPWPEGP